MQPFLKWAGGKRWLFTQSFVDSLPAFDRYVEPFLGGGAGFFAIRPKSALLSDVNPEVIQLYEVVRDHPNELMAALAVHQENHSKDYYYAMRASSPASRLLAAARTLYLNRTCWNGLYRLNLRGEFNVPIGTKTSVVLPNDNFELASSILKAADLYCGDFADTIDQTGRGDLVFVDPPYTVAHNMNGFVKYNEKIFTWNDQLRLRDALERANQRGAKLILTNANHDSVRQLYEGFGKHREVSRSSVISGAASHRSKVSELIVSA